MRLRSFLAGAAGGIGLAAVANRFLSATTRPPGQPLGRDTKTYRWRGFDVSYTEAGKPSDPDLVLFHGVNAAGSSAEFAAVFDALAEDFHVLAPDLPGFGLSDRPPLMYSPSLYVTFVGDFLRDLADDPVVVGSSLTATYAAMAAAADEDRAADATDDEGAATEGAATEGAATEGAADGSVRELVLVCPTADTLPGRQVWLRTLLRSPLVGEALFNALASKRSLRYFQADHGFADMSHADDEWFAYRHRLTHQDGARYAPASFISGFLDPDVDLGDLLADLDTPVTLVWGRDADTSPVETGRDLADRADARLVVIDDAKLVPHYEHPDAFADVVRQSLFVPADAADDTDEADDRAASAAETSAADAPDA